MIRVILVEDQSLFRKGLISIMEKFDDVQVIAEYADGKEFFLDSKKLSTDMCDLIFLDLSLPWKSGLEILEELKACGRTLPPVCILSMFPPAFYLEKTKELGVRGYLTKDCNPTTLHKAIRTITDGNSYFPENEIQAEQPFVFSNLSGRETEVFKLLTKGLTIKEIAYELQISVKSVSTYKSRLMEKLGVESLSDLYKMAAMCHEAS
ncbi:MAG: LuxR C-terminal-related transcriptional regulator [Sphaerochaetaceae bacterium]